MITEGLSKWCGAGGWRLGLIIIPDSLSHWKDQMVQAASETFSCVSAPIQYAAVTAYIDSTTTENFLEKSRAILKVIARYVSKELHEANILCPAPEGGFYLFSDFSFYSEALKQRGIEDSAELCKRLLTETGVALLPGSAFGRSTSELTARLAFVDFDGDQALKWCEKNGTEILNRNFLDEVCPKIVEGTRLIISWMRQGLVK